MYIIAVKDINNNIVQVAQANNEQEAERIHNNIVARYKFSTFTFYNKIQRWAKRTTGGNAKYNGIDTLDTSDYVKPIEEPKELTIEDYKKMIFDINMQDNISTEDYDLISKYENKIKELSEV